VVACFLTKSFAAARFTVFDKRFVDVIAPELPQVSMPKPNDEIIQIILISNTRGIGIG
jgi:hypothetical protein